MARLKTVAAFEEWIADEKNVELMLDKVSSGTTLRDAALSVKQPPMCLYKYFRASTDRTARLNSAREMWVQARKDLLVAKVDVCAPEKGAVARLKLEAEIIDSHARAYYPDVWGERLRVEKTIDVTVNPALLGRARQLLNKVAAREPLVIEQLAPATTSAQVEEGE